MAIPTIDVRRLERGDESLAQELFAVLAEVFEEEYRPVSARYVEELLSRSDFWAVVALAGEQVVGGITAHSLPMSRKEERELFIYDVAVQKEHQRKGIGRALMKYTVAAAAAQGIQSAFVAADDEDTHALEFYRATGGRGSAVTIFDFSPTRRE